MKKKFYVLLLFSVLFSFIECSRKHRNNPPDIAISRHQHIQGCIFCEMSIIKKNTVFFEDTSMIAFRSLDPDPPIHTLCIPKVHIENLIDIFPGDELLLGQILLKVAELGNTQCPNGYRVVINAGADAHQTVCHLHYHILGGKLIIDLAEQGFSTVSILYEDKDMIVYLCNDNNFKVHIIVESGKPINSLSSVSSGDIPLLGRIQIKISELGKKHCPNGFRVIVNSGNNAHQQYPNLRFHILGGQFMHGLDTF
jgi:histidine triad (HIT) family protein